MKKDYIAQAMRARAPWSSPEPWSGTAVLNGKRKRQMFYDTPEEIARCESCPYPKDYCDGNVGHVHGCRYRLTGEIGQRVMDKLQGRRHKKMPTPPTGYDEEKLKAAMVHNYLQEDIAKALGISKHMLRKWLEWMEGR